MTTATVTRAGILAFAHAVGLPTDEVTAGPLYVAARSMPDCIAWAKAAVPMELHHSGLHVGQEIRQHRPLLPEEVIESTATASTREGSSGTLVTVHVDGRSAAEPVLEQRSTFLFRGERTASAPQESAAAAMPEASLVVDLPAGAAGAYAEASGDRQSIHLDDKVARAAGFPRAIVHGMYACVVVAAAILRQRELRHSAVTDLAVRFRAPLLWGDRLGVEVDEIGLPGATIGFTATTERGVPALTHGRIGLAAASSAETGARAK